MLKIRELETRAREADEKSEQKLKEKDEHIQYLDQLNSDCTVA